LIVGDEETCLIVVCRSVSQCVAVWSQCAAVCCSVVQCGAVCCMSVRDGELCVTVGSDSIFACVAVCRNAL